MKDYKIIFRLSLCWVFALVAFGQSQTIVAQRRATIISHTQTRVDSVVASYTDSLKQLKMRYANYRYADSDTLSNPYYFYLFSAPTYYDAAVGHSFALSHKQERANKEEWLVRQSGMYLTELYGQRPYLIRYNEPTTVGEGLRQDVLRQTAQPSVQLAEKVVVVPAATVDEGNLDWDVQVAKPNFWTFPVNFSMQFMQSYVSDNWYKGGESNYAALASLVAEANYDNKQKLLFTNKLEMKLGFQSSKSDAVHKYKTNTDLLRMTNKLGIQATKHWYYTLMLQSWTQFYKGYRSNDSKVYSDFMSPFESLLSLGMDYKLNTKKWNLTATISPIAVDFIYVARSPLATSHGVKENRHFNWEFGSNITINSRWTIAPNIIWTSRAYFYTDYTRTQIEWENTFQMKLNKYLSTKVFLYPRFDDNARRKDGRSYFQFYENFSFGLDLSF